MPIIKEKDAEFLRETFAERLRSDVTLVFFTQEHECMYCRETRGFLDELVALSDKIHLETYDLVADADKAKEHGIDKIPAIKIIGDNDYGLRYFGMPMGYEFTVIVEDIIDASWGTSDMDPETMGNILPIDESLHIQVFVSPTCPYCPQMVRAAHKFAMLNPMITADMVEMTEFPQLVQKYDVMGVPKTIINEEFSIEGAYPEKAFSEYVKVAAEGKFGSR
ncbi:MAG: thioredoxin family protein [Thermoplasmata archaeon]|nr:MAG: thioredoxin family protein [Thermoplasmata archaeon]